MGIRTKVILWYGNWQTEWELRRKRQEMTNLVTAEKAKPKPKKKVYIFFNRWEWQEELWRKKIGRKNGVLPFHAKTRQALQDDATKNKVAFSLSFFLASPQNFLN